MRLYGWFAFLGLTTLVAALLVGFRNEADAPASNYAFNGVWFAIYMAVHYAMMQPWFKKAVTGRPEGSPAERRVYVSVAVLGWVALYAFHRPLPGPELALPAWAGYLGTCGVLLGFLGFVEGATFESLKGLVGIPGREQTHALAAETPLLTEGSYASVRHPMYRGFLAACAASLLIHPNGAQLAWAILLGATFIVFIPLEERQLLAARGEEYQRYMQVTRYRVVRGVW